jgi:formyl-CoA transferase
MMDPSAFVLRHAPPELGEHGEAILAELGYPPDRIAALKSAEILR